MGEVITPIEAIDAALAHLQDKIRTLLPAVIVTYDEATNRATVRLGRLNKTKTGAVFGPQELPDLPVDWPNGGGMFFRFDLLPGDEVEISVADRSLGDWQEVGGNVEPTDGDAMHHLSDARVRPWISSDVRPRPLNAKGLYLGKTDGTATIKISPAGLVEVEGVTIKLGATATDVPALALLLQTFLISIATTAEAAAVGGDGGSAAFLSFIGGLAGLKAAAGATKVSAE